MNHFLLAEPTPGSGTVADQNYGIFLMELLINQMMTRGGVKSRMKAHIYGGGNMHAGMTRIGDANARFAQNFLADEGIPVMRQDVGGDTARRVDFDPVLGRTRCRHVEKVAAPVSKPVSQPATSGGELELF
jgi:chemotaxis protein CheD